MAPKTKQADRNTIKKTKKQTEDEVDVAGGQSGSRFLELAKTLAVNSVLAENVPAFPNLVKDGIAIIKGEKTTEKQSVQEQTKESNEEETKENNEDEVKDKSEQESNEQGEPKIAENDTVPDHVLEKDVCSIFGKICSRLHWSNPLGLATPASGEDSLKAWLAMKDLEVDFGPRSKKKGTPGLDRITTNLYNNLPQYLHILLFLMILRSFLFRSFFACLPWLTGYQCLSVFLPLDKLPSLPQIPLEKVPVEIRIVVTVGLNGLLQLFFAYELLWKSYFFEKFLVMGLVAYHAYAVRPVEA